MLNTWINENTHKHTHTNTHTHTHRKGAEDPQGCCERSTACWVSQCYSPDEPLAWRVSPLMKSSEFHKHINHCCTAGRKRRRRRRWRRVKWGYKRKERVERWQQHDTTQVLNQYTLWRLMQIMFVGRIFYGNTFMPQISVFYSGFYSGPGWKHLWNSMHRTIQTNEKNLGYLSVSTNLSISACRLQCKHFVQSRH